LNDSERVTADHTSFLQSADECQACGPNSAQEVCFSFRAKEEDSMGRKDSQIIGTRRPQMDHPGLFRLRSLDQETQMSQSNDRRAHASSTRPTWRGSCANATWAATIFFSMSHSRRY